MAEKKRSKITREKIRKKAEKVIGELLESEDEKIKLQAAKTFPDNEKAIDELLDSENEKTRLQAAEIALVDISGKVKKAAIRIISPYELWRKKNRGKGGSGDIDFKNHWFGATGYIPHRAQSIVHASNSRFTVLVSGRRFGKSLLASKEAEAVLMRPDKRVWIVAPTYALTDKVFREIYGNLVIKGAIEPKAIVRKSESERIIRLAWGSEVLGRSAENPDSLIGEAVDFLIFDECAKSKKSVWEKYLRPTLTDRRGRALFITTPEGTNWVYQLYLRGQRKKGRSGDDWASFLFATGENPHIGAEEILDAKNTLAPEVFEQEYMAGFFSFSGKVYKEFSIHTHVNQLKLTI